MLEFDKQSYSVKDKNLPETPILRLYCPSVCRDVPQETFPISVTVEEKDGTATGM